MQILKPKSEFSRNVLTLMTGTTIAQAIPIAISPILTRLYTPEDFGVFALFLAIVGFFSVFISLRYEQVIVLVDNDEDAINIFALGFIIILLITTILTFSIFIFHDYIIELLKNDEISFWLYFAPITVLLIGVFNLLTHFNNRKKYYKDISNATIIKSIVLAVVQLSVGFVKQGVTGLITGQIVAQFFANIKLAKNITKDKILLKKIDKSKIIQLAIKYKDFPKFQAPHAMLNSLSSNMPVLLFSSFFSATIVGFFALSTRIVLSPMMIIASSTAKVYNQKVSVEYNKVDGDPYGFTIRVLKSLLKKITMPFLLIVFFAPDIFAFAFGENWKDAGIYTQLLSPWLLMVFLVSNIIYIPSLLSIQEKALSLEIIYTILRFGSLIIGIALGDIYIAIGLFSSVGFFMLSYNMFWMLKSLREVK